MLSTVPTRASAENLINSAERVIRTFGGPHVTRAAAEALLESWGHRGSLSADDRGAVLDRFGPPVLPAPDGHQFGGRR